MLDPAADTRDSRANAGPAIFAWGAWFTLVVADLALILTCGPNLPIWDDIGILPVLCGDRPVDLGWLWSPHNEHRVPLPRLVLVGVLRLSRDDFRSGMITTALCLAAGAAALLGGVRAARGRRAYADAFLPILMLHPGHHTNLLWCWQVQFGLSALCATLVIAVLIRPPGSIRWPASLLAALALVALPLCGLNGVAMVPGLALALGASGWLERTRRPARLVAIGGAILAVLVASGVVATGIGPASAKPTIGQSTSTAMQFLGVGLGRSIQALWPYGAFVVVGLVLGSFAVLLRAALLGSERRRPALVLMGGLIGTISLALAVGWGRGQAGDLAGFESRYATIAAPFLVIIYLVAELCAPVVVGRFVGMGLLVLGLLMLWPNSAEGLSQGLNLRDQARDVEADLRDGLPPYRLIRKYTPFLQPSQHLLEEMLRKCKEGRIGPFHALAADPALVEQALPFEPTDSRQIRLNGDVLESTGTNPRANYRLDRPTRVAGLRLRYDHTNASGDPARFRLLWRRAYQPAAPTSQMLSEWNLPTGSGHELLLWIDDDVLEFLIQPDNQPCQFRIRELTLLLPEGPP